MDCLFCKIAAGEIPSSKVYENESILAFLDIQPVNRGHVLVIPKLHFERIADIDDEILGKIIKAGNKINKAIYKSSIKPEGLNLFLADGKAAGQEVFHTHLHLIPRFANDGFGLTFPEGYSNPPSREELEKIAEEIRNNL